MAEWGIWDCELLEWRRGRDRDRRIIVGSEGVMRAEAHNLRRQGKLVEARQIDRDGRPR